MQATTLALFRKAAQAHAAFTALREAGMLQDNLSLVLGAPLHELPEPGFVQLPASDGAAEAPLGVVSPPGESEGSYRYESHIGGGIGTSKPSDSVSAVEEMDDSEEAAESMAYPASGHSYSEQEALEIRHGVNEGYMDFTLPSNGKLDVQEDEVDVEGFGKELIGEGSLTFLLLPLTIGARAPSPLAAFRALGMPHAQAKNYALSLALGAAVLAVDSAPWLLSDERVREIVDAFGPLQVEVCEAKVQADGKKRLGGAA